MLQVMTVLPEMEGCLEELVEPSILNHHCFFYSSTSCYKWYTYLKEYACHLHFQKLKREMLYNEIVSEL